MSPVRSKSDESNSSVPKTLCNMSNHLGCVNSVSWSINGECLASGGDDAIVMVWQIKFQGMAKSNFGGGTSHEQWGCVHMLRGHSGDILGVNWSGDQKYLASCSVDNSIIIWNAKDLPQKVYSISGHQGLVKGVSWDPVGKYMASQSDDRSVRIWRTSDWKEVKQISKPFTKCGGTTHVLRLSWSPDGKFIVSAHALNNDGPIAQIIEREDWKTGIDFVGHRKAIEVVSFNPHLFVKSNSLENHGCIAIGSRDRALSIWLTNLKRPLVVTHDLFKDSILDLSWSKDGYELLVCSTDGSIAYLEFSEKELGVKISEQALDDIFVATYGSKRTCKDSHNSSAILVEDPEMLNLHGASSLLLDSTPSETASKVSTEIVRSMDIVSTSSNSPTVTKQLEVRTKDGRRRITPVTLTTQPSSLSGVPLPFTSFSPKQKKGVTVVSESPSKTKKDSTGVQKSNTSSSLTSPPPKPIHFEPLSTNKEEVKVDKKTSSPQQGKPALQKRSIECSATNLPRAKKLKQSREAGSDSGTGVPSRTNTQRVSNITSSAKPSPVVALTVPSLMSTLTQMLEVPGAQETDPLTLEVDNNLTTSHAPVMTCQRGETMLWSTALSSPCLAASGSHFVTCAVTNDKGMHVFSTQTGRALLPQFVLPSLPHALRTASHFIMLVSSTVDITVWDMQSLTLMVRRTSAAHLLQDGNRTLQLESTSLTSAGLPVLTVKGTSYVYHRDMEVWVVASGNSDESEILSLLRVSTSDSRSTPLQQIQRASGRTDSIRHMFSNVTSLSPLSNTLKHLENQISLSLCLQSPSEYSDWCRAYVQRLVKENKEKRLREFCLQFTAPVRSRDGLILGLRKETLLRDFLTIIADNVKLQRLYCLLRDCIDK